MKSIYEMIINRKIRKSTIHFYFILRTVDTSILYAKYIIYLIAHSNDAD